MVITVTCPSCSAAFPVDPAKIPEGGVNARCSSCGDIFRVEKPAPEPELPTLEAFAPETPTSTATPEPEPEPTSPPVLPSDAPTSEMPVAAPVPEAPAPPPLPEPAPPPPLPEPAEPTPEPEAWTPEPAPATEEPPMSEPMSEPPMSEPMSEPPTFEPAPDPPTPEPAAEPAAATTDLSAPAADPFTETAPFEQPVAEAPEPSGSGVQGFTFGKRDPTDKAKRLARVLVSDMIMYNAERHQSALAAGTLVQDFEEEIEKSWKEFVEQVGPDLANGEGRQFWTSALNDILAKGQQVF